jgi:hypothetical protein
LKFKIFFPSRKIFSLLLFIYIATWIFPFHIKAQSISVDTGFHYTRGDFGTDNSTTYISTPLHIKLQPLKFLVTEITIPYIYQKRTDIITIGGLPFSGSQGQGFGSTSYGGGQGGGPHSQNQQGSGQGLNKSLSIDKKSLEKINAAGIDPNDPASIKSLSESVHGIGDIYLLFSSDFHNFFSHFSPYIPTIDFSAGIKLPTAETEKRLGTGEYDYTLGLSLTWDLGKTEYYLYGDYIWVGDTPNEAFENIYCFGCGIGIDLNLIYTLMSDLSGCTALYSDVSPHYSFDLGIKRKIFKHYWIHGYGVIGLNDESNDYGFGLSIGIDF